MRSDSITAEGDFAVNDVAYDFVRRAVDKACRQLHIPESFRRERDVIAGRIADLARSGLRDVKALSDRVVRESHLVV